MSFIFNLKIYLNYVPIKKSERTLMADSHTNSFPLFCKQRQNWMLLHSFAAVDFFISFYLPKLPSYVVLVFKMHLTS